MWLKRMKKKLNVDSIQSELRGGSAFFPGYKSPDSPTSKSVESTRAATMDEPPRKKNIAERPQSNRDTTIPRHHDTTVSSHRDTTQPSQDTDIFEVVRKA